MALKDVVARNVRNIRHAKGMTQEELAEKSGLSPRYIGKLEQFKTAPSVTTLELLADALGVEPTVLITRGKKGG